MKTSIKLDLRKLSKKTQWQRGVFLSVLVSLVVFVATLGFLFIKPVAADVKTIIDEEVSSTDITFNEKTIEMLKKRQEPAPLSQPVIGKNPFLPF